jgi:hypothetical protein
MPKSLSLTGGQRFILFLVTSSPASLTHCITWSPFDPVLNLYFFVYTAVASYVLRVFLFPDQRRSLTWFEFLIAFVCLLNIVEAYSTSISSGELFWRAATWLTGLLIHFRVHKIPLLPGRKRPTDPSIADTIKGEVTELVHTTETESRENLSGAPKSGRFVVLLVLLLSLHPYQFVVLKLELDPVAVLRSKGADVTGTGTFGSVDSIESGHTLTDDDLEHLQRVTSLKELDLESRHITDSGLVHLEGLSGLTVLRLLQTQVTDDGAAKLKKALPDCKIIVERAYAKLKTF